MNELTNSDLVFLMHIVEGIANGLDALDTPCAYEDFGDAYNAAITLKRKLFDELERRNKEEN